MVLTVVALAFLNYRGVLATLTLNLVITAAAFAAIVVLFVAAQPWAPGAVLQHESLFVGLPYGSLASSRRCISACGSISASRARPRPRRRSAPPPARCHSSAP